jgi:hypothetical protein
LLAVYEATAHTNGLRTSNPRVMYVQDSLDGTSATMHEVRIEANRLRTAGNHRNPMVSSGVPATGFRWTPAFATKTPVLGSGGRHKPMPTIADQPVAISTHITEIQDMPPLRSGIKCRKKSHNILEYCKGQPNRA